MLNNCVEGSLLRLVNPDWLSKEMITGIKKFNLDAYLVALEGWRRGLSLKWYYSPEQLPDNIVKGTNPIGKMFSLGTGEDLHYFYRTRGGLVSADAVKVAEDKVKTRKYLANATVSIPKGQGFDKTMSDEEVIADAKEIGFPLVIKSAVSKSGKAVITNIQSEEALRAAVKEVRNEKEHPRVIVEQFCSGDTLRVYVAGDRILGAIKRIPAYVIGDGKKSIESLIIAKNKARKENAFFATRPISITEEVFKVIESQNYTLQSVPKAFDTVYIKNSSNVYEGGETIDITDTLSSDVYQMAVNAVKSIPGLHHAGVDIMATDRGNFVIELDPTATLGLHLFPSEGCPRNIPAGIIDYYFPETKGLAEERAQIYFDYKQIRDLLLSKQIKEVEITDAPNGKIYAKRYVISGKVQQVGYRNWVRRNALKHDLNGYTRNLGNGKVVVVVGSEDEKKVNAFKDICYEGPRRAHVEDIREYDWEKRVKVGFEIKAKNKLL